jgi:hypothetical protein
MNRNELLASAEALLDEADAALDRIIAEQPGREPLARYIRDETVRVYVEVFESKPARRDWTSVAARLMRAMALSEALDRPLQ